MYDLTQIFLEHGGPPLRDLSLEHLKEIGRRCLHQPALTDVVLVENIEVWVKSTVLVNVVVRVGVVFADDAVDVVRKIAAAAEYITVVCQADRVVILKRASSLTTLS